MRHRERPEMDYTFERLDSTDIGIIRVTGEFRSPEDGMKLQALSIRLHAELNVRRFIYDLTRRTFSSACMEAFATANPPVEMGRQLRRLRGAIIFSGLTDHERFLENVAMNRGYLLRVFDDMDQAMLWLQQGS